MARLRITSVHARKVWTGIGLATAAAATLAWALVSQSQDRSETLASIPLDRALTGCMAGITTNPGQSPSVTVGALSPEQECLRQALVAGVRNGTFRTIETISGQIARSSINGICHAAAHQAGLELAQTYSLEDALEQMFENKPSKAEPACGTGVVHGLVQGQPSDKDSLSEIATQCTKLRSINPDYSNECAHYYGHNVYKHTQSISEDLGKLCQDLDPSGQSWNVQSCVSGAVMEKFQLQDRSYNFADPTAPMGPPPRPQDLSELCAPLLHMSADVQGGCANAQGWLLSQHVGSLLEEANLNPSTIADRQTIVDHYIEALTYCKDTSCVMGVYTHLRSDLYQQGVNLEICADPRSVPWLNDVDHEGLCNTIANIRKGL